MVGIKMPAPFFENLFNKHFLGPLKQKILKKTIITTVDLCKYNLIVSITFL